MKRMTKREIVDQVYRLEAMEDRARPNEKRLVLEPNYRDRWLMSHPKTSLEGWRRSEFRWVAKTLREKEAA